MKLKRQRKCLNCRDMFDPDYRNVKSQAYCRKPECRKASKAASQKKWCEKPENKDYYKGPVHVQRVQEWRKKHPKGASKKETKSRKVLQDHCHENSIEIQLVTDDKNSRDFLLQDLCDQQLYVIIGLIAQLTGSTLQDNIEMAIHRMRELGRDIFINPNRKEGGQYDPKTTHLPGTRAKGSPAVQLDRPPPGPGASH